MKRQTLLMEADEIAFTFNSVDERVYWNASVGGSRLTPTVIFSSRASMVKITYYVGKGDFKVSFTRMSCSFGDFMASIHRSLDQILTALKAAGLNVQSPVGEGVNLRCEYDPITKETSIGFASLGADWGDPAYITFKDEEENKTL